MSEEDNKVIVRRFFEEVWNQQKDNVIDEIFASTVVLNGQAISRTHSRRLSRVAAPRSPTSM
jgi:hypothetical protein